MAGTRIRINMGMTLTSLTCKAALTLALLTLSTACKQGFESTDASSEEPSSETSVPTAAGTTDTTTPSPTPAAPAVSADGTEVPREASRIVDSLGNEWTLVNSKVAKNGKVDPVTGWVQLLLYYKGVLYQENTGHQFYAYTGSGWSAAMGDPRAQAAPTPTPSTPPASGGSPDTTLTGRVPVGIQHLQLVWSDKTTIDATFDGMGRDLPGLQWARIDFQDNDPTQAANFVEEVRKAHQYGMKVLAMTSTTSGDCGGSFPYRLSALNTTAFAARLRTYMNALKAAGQNVEAWEIGNELDTTGFNSDDPGNVELFKQSYAKMIQTAVQTIKDPAYASAFPNTKVITVGFANMSTYCPECHLPNPAAALAALKNYNGVNYLAGVDGYGFHVYPAADNMKTWTQAIFQQYQDAGLNDKPVWITEWGFHRAQFPYNGHPRSWSMDQFLQFVNGYAGLKFGAAILFDYRGDAGENYDFDIYDGNTLRQDEANVLINWSR